MTTFKCAVCKKICNGALTEDEALAQFEREFPGQERSDDLVCADCFQKLSTPQDGGFTAGLLKAMKDANVKIPWTVHTLKKDLK